jgi:Mor family transcriptional regulator
MSRSRRDAFDLIDFTKQNLGLSEYQADQFGRKLVEHFSCGNLYVGSLNRIYRDRDIRSAFNGHNHKQLARDFGLSERQIYNIVNP